MNQFKRGKKFVKEKLSNFLFYLLVNSFYSFTLAVEYKQNKKKKKNYLVELFLYVLNSVE